MDAMHIDEGAAGPYRASAKLLAAELERESGVTLSALPVVSLLSWPSAGILMLLFTVGITRMSSPGCKGTMHLSALGM